MKFAAFISLHVKVATHTLPMVSNYFSAYQAVPMFISSVIKTDSNPSVECTLPLITVLDYFAPLVLELCCYFNKYP